MVAPRLKSVKHQLPALLRKARSKNETADVKVKRILQLAECCGVSGLLDAFVAEPEGTERKAHLYLLFMAGIGTSLLQTLVKPYRPSRQRISPVAVEDWIKAGGAAEDIDYASPHFYAAQLVQLIKKVEQEKGKSREWVFDWLFNKNSSAGPREAERRLALLPGPYKRRTTRPSLKEAFSKIPGDVKREPENHLPSRRGFRLAVALARSSNFKTG